MEPHRLGKPTLLSASFSEHTRCLAGAIGVQAMSSDALRVTCALLPAHAVWNRRGPSDHGGATVTPRRHPALIYTLLRAGFGVCPSDCPGGRIADLEAV